jgi:long-chain fatty acid transport protein
LKDTWHFAIGGQYRIAKPWLLSAGFAYNTSPMSVSDRSPSLPLDRTFRYSGGIQYDWSKNMTLGLACTFIDAGSSRIDKTGGPLVGNLQGDYDPNYINIVNLNLIYRF